MLKTLTRYPSVLGASIFILFGVVYAQVVPEEQPTETQEEVATSTPEVVIEETVTASTTELNIEEMATSIEEVNASTTDAFVEVDTATATEPNEPSVVVTEPPSDQIVASNVSAEFDSADDITKPSECRSESALLFFKTIGECSRYVINKISEEKLKSIERAEPEFAPDERY